jgi:hypothetical protein
VTIIRVTGGLAKFYVAVKQAQHSVAFVVKPSTKTRFLFGRGGHLTEPSVAPNAHGLGDSSGNDS